MILVKDIYSEVSAILGFCDEDLIFQRLNHAVEILTKKGNWDPLIGWADICVKDCRLTLPYNIETILALNIGGRPTFGRDKWFEYHLNGPGTPCGPACGYTWSDKGDSCLFEELDGPSQLYAASEDPRDNNKVLKVFGWDIHDKWIMETDCNGNLVDGFTLPVLYGKSFIGQGVPFVKKIERIYKEDTYGFVKLFAGNNHGGTLVGYYLPYENTPSYRHILLSQNCAWARIQYRKKVFKIRSQLDLIPLNSEMAILAAVQAVKAYFDRNYDESNTSLTAAVNFLREDQISRNPSTTASVQVRVGTMCWNKNEFLN